MVVEGRHLLLIGVVDMEMEVVEDMERHAVLSFEVEFYCTSNLFNYFFVCFRSEL